MVGIFKKMSQTSQTAQHVRTAFDYIKICDDDDHNDDDDDIDDDDNDDNGDAELGGPKEVNT